MELREFKEYKEDILEWEHDCQDAYYKIRRAIRDGMRDFDDALTVYAYAIKLLDVKPSGLVSNNQGALLTRMLQNSRTQLYWKVVRMVWRSSLYWGTVFTVGCFLPGPLEMVVKAWLLDKGDLHACMMRAIYIEAARHKVTIPYRHLEEKIFTNSLLLGVDSDSWLYSGISNYLLMPLTDFQIIEKNFMKRQDEEQ